MYYVTDGMPEPVFMWTQERDVEAVQEALSNTIGVYEQDFTKHPDVKKFPKISLIWKPIPGQGKQEVHLQGREGGRLGAGVRGRTPMAGGRSAGTQGLP